MKFLRNEVETYENLTIDWKKAKHPGAEQATLEIYDDEKKIDSIDLPWDIEFDQIVALVNGKGLQKKEMSISDGDATERRRRKLEDRVDRVDRRERSSESSCGSEL
mmetsp:Transcript_28772/g.44718  ORF Transcript_28772/g.44718 Transcript_28772/m.44718 type:complete len:106 (-) Transcript_28772:296-613(-)|eukprot:CAMPEP_0196811088 /NCGR_PEP_ID=MMETSP1362-20130617/16946_1 /TAXON_ID=163516 /ORGANISM="Leptocylindrus danicus, Strain CCMP1856" /LENGTH=105 /DNA_ID=CAMNT_0042186339 /DNA_START=185 /DNA_END=502 /DNA_ORIENTATION=-